MNDASINVPNETPKVKLPPTFGDLTGRIFARLTVISFSHIENHQSFWRCKCTCGNVTVVRRVHLITGHTKSCVCLQKEIAAVHLSSKGRKTKFNQGTHKQSGSPEYITWVEMKRRCFAPTSNVFKHYGGRGITVCDRWIKSFQNFFADMGEKPSPQHSIERVNNDGNYEKSNCKWATDTEQANNKRNTVRYDYRNESLTASQWAKKLGINVGTFTSRLKDQGWTIDRAIETPVKSAPK